MEEEKKKSKAHSLIDKIYYRLNLRQAWGLVKQNGGAGGVDGESIERFEKELEKNLESLHEELREDRYQPQPVRRVWIPKANGGKRPLGVPTVRDRVVQQAVRLRLEPLFEPYFLESSYGFRPGRSAHQALGDVVMSIHNRRRWVMEVDIEGFFDTIDQEKLIDLVAERVADGRVLKLLRQMLQSGVMEEMRVHRQTTGTPQGGVISPLLANIYLNRYDWRMGQAGYRVVRFADDLVTCCETKEEAYRALQLTREILEGELHLRLHPGKTRVVHVSEGFEFLGFYFGWGDSFYMTPREKAVKKFREKVKEITRRNRPMKFQEMIRDLNRVIVGLGNYFRYGKCKRMFWRLEKWIRRRVIAFKDKRWKTRLWEKITVRDLYFTFGLKSLYQIQKAARPLSLS